MREHTSHGITYRLLGLKDVKNSTSKLAEKIIRDHIRPTTLVGVKMGGENIAHLLAEELKRWSNIYGVDPYETEPRVLLYDSVSKPPIEHLRYRPILIVEDVFEQGETAGEAWQHISNSKPSNIIGATLYLRSEAVTVPRFYFEEIDKNTVVIFPWDVEYVKQLISKNPEHKYTPEELYQVDGLLPLEVYRGVLAELK